MLIQPFNAVLKSMLACSCIFYPCKIVYTLVEAYWQVDMGDGSRVWLALVPNACENAANSLWVAFVAVDEPPVRSRAEPAKSCLKQASTSPVVIAYAALTPGHAAAWQCSRRITL